MSARRTERLINVLIAFASAPGVLTRAQIRECIPDYAGTASDAAFERMFERDKADLRELGVPLRAVGLDGPDNERGYVLQAEKYSEIPDLTRAEISAIEVAVSLWVNSPLADLAERVRLKVRAWAGQLPEVTPTGVALHAPADPGSLRTVWDAIDTGRVLRFDYAGSDDQLPARRTVQPWRLRCHAGGWYLTGYDTDRGATRTFRLDRMTSAPRACGATGAFSIPEDAAAAERTSMPTSDPVSAQVALRPGGAATFRLMYGIDDNAETATVTSTRPGTLRDDCIEYSGSVRLLHPSSLHDAQVRAVREVADLHGGEADTRGVTGETPPPAPSQTWRPARAPRLARVLTIATYADAHPGVSPRELAAVVGGTVGQVISDLELLFVCGRPGHMPDDLIDASWEHDMVFVSGADDIARPLRLTASEVGVIMTALAAMTSELAVAGDVVDSLRRKLSVHLPSSGGAPSAPAVNVMGSRPAGEFLPLVREALSRGVKIRLDYVSAGRDEATSRLVDPVEVQSFRGHTYLHAWCDYARAERLFRTDRIRSATLTDIVRTRVTPERKDSVPLSLGRESESPWAVVRLTLPAKWVREMPGVIEAADDLVYLQYTHVEWLVRLLLRLNGGAEVVAPAPLRQSVATELTRIAAQYHEHVTN